jgi:RNA polymerase sigma-70 factor (ECF subfamily)
MPERPAAPRGGDSGGGAPEHRLESTIELLGRARGGDSAALDRLIARYRPRLCRWASGRLPDRMRSLLDTEDLVQDVLLRTVRRIEAFQPDASGSSGGFHAYVRSALTNRLRDEIRLAKRLPHETELLPEAPHEDPAPLPIEDAIGRDEMARYEAALARLRPEEREMVIARVEMDMTYEEIGEAMGKPSKNAARMATVRAIERLAREMAAGEGAARRSGERP